MKLPLILLAILLTLIAIMEVEATTDQRLYCWDYQYKCERV